MANPVFVVRVKGGLVEELDGAGESTRGKAFPVPAELATKILADGSERFRPATDAEVKELQSAQKGSTEAKLKAAGPPPKSVTLSGGVQ